MKRRKISLQFFAEPAPGDPAPAPAPQPQPPEPQPENATLSKIVATYKAQIADLQAQIADRDNTIALILDGKPAPAAGEQPQPTGTQWNPEFLKLLRE